MTNSYRIICPECRAEIPEDTSPNKVCPTCKKDVTNSFEILFQPSAQSNIPRKIAIVILIFLALIILIALLSAYL